MTALQVRKDILHNLNKLNQFELKITLTHLTTQSPLLGVVYFTNPLNIGVYMEEHRIDEDIRQQANNYSFIPETISSLKLLVIKRNPNSELSLLDIPTLNAIGGTS